MAKTQKKKLTAADLVDLLRLRWEAPAWILMEEVRNGTGFSRAPRTADVLAMQTYPSRGIYLYGAEIKVSRSDVEREIQQPKKADALQRYCKRWYLVVSDKKILESVEIPENWGVLAPSKMGVKLLTVKEAPELKPVEWDHAFIASLVRSAFKDNPAEKVLKDAVEAARKQAEDHVSYRTKRDQESLRKLRKFISVFEGETGIRIDDWDPEEGVLQKARAFKQFMKTDLHHSQSKARRYAELLEDVAKQIREGLKAE